MKFGEALNAMKDGKRVKLPSWGGYWAWEDGTIMMHCKDGLVLDIRESEDVNFTMRNVASEEWQIAGDNDIHIDPGKMSFGAAIYALKRGQKVARAGWNGKDQYIELASDITYRGPTRGGISAYHKDIGSQAICFVGTRGCQIGWLASQSDMLAEDWHVVPQPVPKEPAGDPDEYLRREA